MRPVPALVMEQEARIPVWMALSELYLDTDVTTAYACIVRTLAASPYTLDELRTILMDEVHPALHANLLQVAGEWAGFEQTWLIEHIRSVRDTPLWRRRLSRLHFGLVREDWRAIEAMVRTARSAPAQS
jgi:hypothetical protein